MKFNFDGRTFHASEGFRAFGDYDGGNTNPFLTQFIVAQQAPNELLGNLLFREIEQPGFTYNVRAYEPVYLQGEAPKMGPFADFRRIRMRADTRTGKMDRYGLATELDAGYEERQAQQLAALGVGSESELNQYDLAFRVLNLGLEGIRASIALDTTRYPAGNVVNLAAGSEWNTPNGDSQGTINVLVRAITNANAGIDRRLHIAVLLTEAAYEAAKLDPAIVARLSTSATATNINPKWLADYWEVADVTVRDSTSVDTNGVVTRPFGDAVFVHVIPQRFNLLPGSTGTIYDGFVEVGNVGRGQALERRALPESEVVLLPVRTWKHFDLVNPATCAVALNTSATE